MCTEPSSKSVSSANDYLQRIGTISYYLFGPDIEPSDEELLLKLSDLPKESELHLLCTNDVEQSRLQKRLQEAHVQVPPHTHYHINYLSSGSRPYISRLPVADAGLMSPSFSMRSIKVAALL